MRIFLSHATETKPLVRQITSRLPAHVDLWLDQDELSTGVRFPERIEEAIAEQCDFVLVFVDSWALQSEWVRREVGLALERERDLQRPYLLPILLEPLQPRLHELGALDDRLYLEALDPSETGVAAAAEALTAQLFALLSQAIEGTRGEGRRGLLRAFSRDLTAYKNAAFLWLATLGDSLRVLSSNQAAFDHVRQAVQDYNTVADRVIPLLGTYRDRITAAWAAHRGLCQDLREFVEFVDNEVYRGALFRLNEIHEMIHALALEGAPADTTALDERKEALRATAEAALTLLAQRSTALVTELEQEI